MCSNRQGSEDTYDESKSVRFAHIKYAISLRIGRSGGAFMKKTDILSHVVKMNFQAMLLLVKQRQRGLRGVLNLTHQRWRNLWLVTLWWE